MKKVKIAQEKVMNMLNTSLVENVMFLSVNDLVIENIKHNSVDMKDGNSTFIPFLLFFTNFPSPKIHMP